MDYLASGLDPENGRTFFFSHSHVPELNQLLLPFMSLVTTAELDRNPTVKDEIRAAGLRQVNALMYTYPIHQAADILFCKGNVVPVGRDQAQHLEIARDVATALNARHRRTLPLPEPLIEDVPTVVGLDGRKMSKSYGNTIEMTDPEPVVRQKLKTMVTDPARVRRTDPGDPDKCPVGDLHKVFSTPETLARVYEGCRTAGIGCIECKSWAADALVQVLKPIQERRESFGAAEVDDILKDGSDRARVRAEQTMVEVRAAMQLTAPGVATQQAV